jgi:hypothetical protein
MRWYNQALFEMPEVPAVSLADEFASILCKQLNKILPASDWSCSGRIGSGREAVDVCGKLTGRPVYSEVELRRDESLTNVVKIWRAIKEKGHTTRVILVHAFSGNYPPHNAHRLNAVFIGKQMQRSCGATYIPVYFRYGPRAGATVAGYYRRRAAKSLAFAIRDTLHAV